MRNRVDARAQRTRAALRGAFAGLVRTHRYEEIKVDDIAVRAGVSRSTFYAHYSGKDGLMTESIAGPFAVLADVTRPDFSDSTLVELLDHFWENRAIARGLLLGTAGRKAGEVLVRLIERRLKSAGPRSAALIVPPRLAAIQLSQIALAPITAWLLGESRCSSRVLSAGLRRMSVAALGAITRPAAQPR